MYQKREVPKITVPYIFLLIVHQKTDGFFFFLHVKVKLNVVCCIKYILVDRSTNMETWKVKEKENEQQLFQVLNCQNHTYIGNVLIKILEKVSSICNKIGVNKIGIK